MDEVFGEEQLRVADRVQEDDGSGISELLCRALLTTSFGMRRIEDRLKFRQLYRAQDGRDDASQRVHRALRLTMDRVADSS